MGTDQPDRERVLLVNFVAEFAEQESFYSLGLYCLKTYAESFEALRGQYDISVFDIRPGTPDSIQRILEHRADVVGFSCYLWSVDDVLGAMAALRAANPEVTILVGGVPEDLLAFPDELPDGLLVCEGHQEGEPVLAAVLQARLRSQPMDTVPGVRVVAGGELGGGRESGPLPDVNTIPSPYLTGVIDLDPGNRYFQLQTTRGCVGRCAYCIAGESASGLRDFALGRVAEELVWAAEHGVEVVVITDAAINYRDARLAALRDTLVDAIREHPLRLTFCLHPAYVTPEQVEILRPLFAATDAVIMGVQSLSPAAQATMHRPFDNVRVLRGIRLVSDVITPHVDLILGAPGETLATFRAAVETLMEYSVHLQIHPLSLVRGTAFSRRRAELGISHEDHRGQNRVTSSATFSGEDFYRSVLFVQRLALDGALEDSRLQSLSLNGFPYFVRKPDPGAVAERAQPAPAEPPACAIAPSLLAAIQPLTRIGAEHEGWTVVESTRQAETIDLTVVREGREIGLRLQNTTRPIPCFERTARFGVLYRFPDELSPTDQAWLRSFVRHLAQLETPAPWKEIETEA